MQDDVFSFTMFCNRVISQIGKKLIATVEALRVEIGNKPNTHIFTKGAFFMVNVTMGIKANLATHSQLDVFLQIPYITFYIYWDYLAHI